MLHIACSHVRTYVGARVVYSSRMRGSLQRGMAMELEVPEIKRSLSVNEYQRLRPRSLSPDPRHLSPQPPVRISLAATY